MTVAAPSQRPEAGPDQAAPLPPSEGTNAVPSAAPVLTCQGLTKRFGDRLAVGGVGFEMFAS